MNIGLNKGQRQKHLLRGFPVFVTTVKGENIIAFRAAVSLGVPQGGRVNPLSFNVAPLDKLFHSLLARH